MQSKPLTIFKSKSLVEHGVRGVIGFLLLYVAIILSMPERSLLEFSAAIFLGAASIYALRGCPVCWTIGLINTGSATLRAKTCPINTKAGPVNSDTFDCANLVK